MVISTRSLSLCPSLTAEGWGEVEWLVWSLITTFFKPPKTAITESNNYIIIKVGKALLDLQLQPLKITQGITLRNMASGLPDLFRKASLPWIEEGISAAFSVTPIRKYKKGRRALHTDLYTTGPVTSFINLFFSYTKATVLWLQDQKCLLYQMFTLIQNHGWPVNYHMKTEENTHWTLISINFYMHFIIPKTRSNCKNWNKNYFQLLFSWRQLNYLYSTPAFLSDGTADAYLRTMTVLYRFISAQSSERHICFFLKHTCKLSVSA